MSMQTERIFCKALEDSPSVTAMVGDRIWPIAIPGTDEEAENIDLPYLVVTYGGFQNESVTKDNPYDGDEDRVQVGVIIAAESADELWHLADRVRNAIDDWMQSYEAPELGEDLSPHIPTGYSITGSEKSLDWMRPCYVMTLNYSCEVQRQR